MSTFDMQLPTNGLRTDCGQTSVSPVRSGWSSQIITFDVPGSAGTFGEGLNDHGTAVGLYLNSRLLDRAFDRSARGTYLTFQAPGAGTTPNTGQGTRAISLTNSNIVVGYYLDATYVWHAYIRWRNGSFTRYEAPGASTMPNDSVPQGTRAGSINSRLDTGGVYYDSQGGFHGFIRFEGGMFRKVNPPGAVLSNVCFPRCLNSHGAATGTFFDVSGNPHGYIRGPNGAYTVIDAPGAVATFSNGINDRDEIAGAYVDPNGISWGYLRYRSGKFVVFQAPDASKTYGNGTLVGPINNAGTVAGIYADASGQIHGFARSQSGKFAEFDPNGSIGTFINDINASNQVTGGWFDAQGEDHGFIWNPR